MSRKGTHLQNASIFGATAVSTPVHIKAFAQRVGSLSAL